MKNCYMFDYKGSSFVQGNLESYRCVPDWWYLHKVGIEVLTIDALDYLTLIGITPWKKFNFFAGNPKSKADIHLDETNQSYAINYTWGSSKSMMRWFRTDDPGEYKQTSAGTPYVNFKNSKMILIEEYEIPNFRLTLVRIDIPHDVVNYSNNPRYCVSVRGNPRLNWEDAVSYFSKHLIA